MNKNKCSIFLISLKKQLLPIILIIFTICLVLFSKQNISAAKSGLALWANSVVPSLLPFFIATELLTHTDIINTIGRFFSPFMRPIFNVPGEGGFALLMGIISGYPVGAKIATQFRQNGICSQVEAERLLAFTNNSGPLFIVGTVGVTMFCDTSTGILLLITHILACLSVGFIFRFWKYNISSTKQLPIQALTKTKKESNGKILANSIFNSINTVMMIGGFVVLFSVIISILNSTNILEVLSNIFKPLFSALGIDSTFCKPFLSGILELTNGVKNISLIQCKSISTNIILCSFLLGFSGISIVLQVYSIISASDISIKPYIIGKFLQGIFASVYTYLLLNYFPFLNLDIQPVFSNINTSYTLTNGNTYFVFFISMICIVFIIGLYFHHQKKEYLK